MTQEGFKRKLTAILSADVIGYSRLMRDDEEATVRDLAANRTLITKIIKQHHGRVVDSPGDNILAEFASIVDAVNGAVKIQEEIRKSNTATPEDRRMEFRIGINLGDVIEEEERIYGDGVNIAARVEGMAAAGGIAISGTVFEHIKDKLSFGYHCLGEQDVKNIPEPVHVYRLLTEPDDAGKIIGEEKPKAKKLRWVAFGALVLILIVVGTYAIWNNYFRPSFEPASLEKMAFPLPDKPSIAVLPFVNASDDPKQEYFCDGLTEEIITALSNVPKLLVIARNSVFTYKGKPVKVNQVAEELGVRYVLEGSIRKAGDEIRITAQLIDALSGHHLWAERYDRNLNEIFAVQDDLTKNIITSLQVELTEGEQVRAAAKGTNNLEAYLKYLQAIDKINQYNIESNALGKQFAQEAIALDPEYSMAYRALHRTHLMDVWLGTSKSPKQSIAKAMELLQKAIELDATYAEAHGNLGFLFSMIGRHDKAVAKAEQAVALNPNSAYAHMILGHALRFAGRHQEAIPEYKKAIRLNPIPPTNYLFGLGLAYAWTGQYEEALKWCEKAVRKDPDSFMAHLMMTVVYSLSGRDEKARAEAAEALRINPKFSVEKFEKAVKVKKKTEKERFIVALRKAGLPDKPPLPLPDKPSIAVLAFENMSGDPEQEYFSDGLSEEIITALSKTPKLFVIARNSSFTYKGKPVKVQQIGRELGVKYVLEGSVRKSGDRVRITAQLVDAKTGNHLWANRYDRDLKDIFSVQDEITKNIITALHVQLTEGEQARLYAKGTANLHAYLKAKEAEWYYLQSTKDGLFKAKQLSEEAIALDPNYAYAYGTLSMFHGISIFMGMSKSPQDSLKRAIELCQKAIAIDDSFAAAHAGLGYWLMIARQYDKAVAEGELAMALAPHSADVIYNYASILTFMGRLEEAIPLFKEAIRLNPMPPNSYLRHFGVALRDSGRYEKAIVQVKKATEKESNDFIAWVVLTSSLSLAGRDEEARTAAKEILRINPKFSVARWEKRSPHKDRAVAKRYCDALRKVGLPD